MLSVLARVIVCCIVFAWFVLDSLRCRFRYNLIKTSLLLGFLIIITAAVTILFLIPGYMLAGHTLFAVILWIVLAVAIFCTVIKGSFWESLFLILVVLNLYVNIVAIAKVIVNICGVSFSKTAFGALVTMAVLAAYLPFLWFLFSRLFKKIIEYNLNFSFWKMIWGLPALTYMIFYVKIINDYWRQPVKPGTEDLIFIVMWSFTTYALFWVTLQMLIQAYKGIFAAEEMKLAASQIKMQEEQYQRLLNDIADTARIRHDWRHHLLTLHCFAEKGEMESVRSYLKALLPTYVPDKEDRFCLNHIVNVILAHYITNAREQGVMVECRVDLPASIALPDTDLCIVFGNLLENGVTACASQTQDVKRLEIKAHMKGRQLVLMVKNTYGGRVEKRAGVYYSTKHGGPGIGISSVQNVAQKHGGHVKIDFDGKYFSVFALMNADDVPGT